LCTPRGNFLDDTSSGYHRHHQHHHQQQQQQHPLPLLLWQEVTLPSAEAMSVSPNAQPQCFYYDKYDTKLTGCQLSQLPVYQIKQRKLSN